LLIYLSALSPAHFLLSRNFFFLSDSIGTYKTVGLKRIKLVMVFGPFTVVISSVDIFFHSDKPLLFVWAFSLRSNETILFFILSWIEYLFQRSTHSFTTSETYYIRSWKCINRRTESYLTYRRHCGLAISCRGDFLFIWSTNGWTIKNAIFCILTISHLFLIIET
jgi:hypothetical protein